VRGRDWGATATPRVGHARSFLCALKSNWPSGKSCGDSMPAEQVLETGKQEVARILRLALSLRQQSPGGEKHARCENDQAGSGRH
jgi:hypothetical protein